MTLVLRSNERTLTSSKYYMSVTHYLRVVFHHLHRTRACTSRLTRATAAALVFIAVGIQYGQGGGGGLQGAAQAREVLVHSARCVATACSAFVAASLNS